MSPQPQPQPQLQTPSSAPVRLSIGDALTSVSGLSPELAARLRDLMRPFIADTSPAIPRASGDAPIPVSPVSIEVVESSERPDGLPGPRWSVLLHGDELCWHAQPDNLLKYLEWLAIAESLIVTSRYVVFHAATLARDGAAVLLVGPSGAGKSTLTLHLMQRGWLPLSDDVALVEAETGLLHPFPRCFHVDAAWSVQVTEQTGFERPAALTGFARPLRWASGGQRATAIFLVERDAAGRSARQPIAQAQAAGALLTQSIKTQRTPAQIAAAAAQVAGGAHCYRLINGDLEGALDLITSPDNLPL